MMISQSGVKQRHYCALERNSANNLTETIILRIIHFNLNMTESLVSEGTIRRSQQ